MDFVYLVASFTVILAGALLFTNAVEWIGHRLELGEGAVALGLAGGAIAYWALRLRDRFELPAVLAWISLYAAFIVVVAV